MEQTLKMQLAALTTASSTSSVTVAVTGINSELFRLIIAIPFEKNRISFRRIKATATTTTTMKCPSTPTTPP
jgi:hypothetical protein